jgi:hypothetical protein
MDELQKLKASDSSSDGSSAPQPQATVESDIQHVSYLLPICHSKWWCMNYKKRLDMGILTFIVYNIYNSKVTEI